jgi:hypothetical protein
MGCKGNYFSQERILTTDDTIIAAWSSCRGRNLVRHLWYKKNAFLPITAVKNTFDHILGKDSEIMKHQTECKQA